MQTENSARMRVGQMRLRQDSPNWQILSELPTQPQLVLYFGPTERLAPGDICEGLNALYPEAIVAGCSTGHAIFEDDIHDTDVVATLIEFNRCEVALAETVIARPEESQESGSLLAQELNRDDLRLVIILSEGLNVNGDSLVRGLNSQLPSTVQIVGGLAGDGPRFEKTVVCANGRSQANKTVAIGIYGDALRVGNGWAGGWDVFGPQRSITASSGAVLHEIDGQPALDLYIKYLGDEAEALPGSALLYPLQIWDPNSQDEPVVRTVLSIDETTRSMTFAGDIPQGWNAQLMVGRLGALVDGARKACENALQSDEANAITKSDRLNLLVSCVGRQLCMQKRTSDEIGEIYESSPDRTFITGFYSYGEIASHGGDTRSGLLNQTMAVTHLWEAD